MAFRERGGDGGFQCLKRYIVIMNDFHTLSMDVPVLN
jgi:hypothetical protein